MCSYCGCQALPVIRLLTIQHEEIINKLEEDGLFDVLMPDEEFGEPLARSLLLNSRLP